MSAAIDTVMPRDPDWGWLAEFAPDLPTLRFGQDYESMLADCRWSPVYLATPYSCEVTDDAGRWQGVKSAGQAARAARWAALMAARDVTVFSPIVMAHAMVTVGGSALDPLDTALWDDWCRRLLNICPRVVVPPLPGRDQSRGIWHEIRWAVLNGRPVHVLQSGDRYGAGDGGGAP